MGWLSAYQELALYIQNAGLFFLIVRMLYLGFAPIYPCFWSYLIVTLVQAGAGHWVPFGTDAYARYFFVSESLVLVLYGLVVLEMYSIILAGLKGIATIARRYIALSVLAAILISVLLLVLEQAPGNPIAKYFLFERAVISSLLFFVMLITAFLVYYPVPLHRNVIYYSIGYAVYFTAKATGLFLLNTGHAWRIGISALIISISTGCILFWTFALRPAGERKTMVLSPNWTRQDEQELLQTLQTINANLLRARK